jgi:tripartite-type tricarboxylate transporter receptor subunit TctC
MTGTPMRTALSWRTTIIGLAAAAWVAGAAAAAAQTYPTRPLQLVVAFPAGGVGDIVARFVADRLTGVLGQPVNVVNRPGSSGTVGVQSVVRAAADGYTLLAGQTTEIVVNRSLAGDVGREPETHLKPVALVAVLPLVLAVPAGGPYATVEELLKGAAASPRGLSFASGSPGTPGHLAAELLRLRTKSRLSHVPYDGGAAALDALLKNRVDFYFPVLLTAKERLSNGQLKALAVSTAQRSAVLPDVPTLAEIGITDIDITHWIGIFAPGETPQAVVETLNRAINQVLADPSVVAYFRSNGAEVKPLTVAEFADYLKVETDRYARLIRREFCSNLWYGGCVGFYVQ